jgi:hypothetical protein
MKKSTALTLAVALITFGIQDAWPGFLVRFLTYPQNDEVTNVAWYSPMERVAGSQNPKKLKHWVGDDSPLSHDAFRTMYQYAEDTNSSALKERSEPFLAKDLFFLDGGGKQRVYVLPSQEAVIVRIGNRPKTWDDSVLPNTLVKGLHP